MGGESAACAPGRRADVVIWSGDPLEGTARRQLVLIDGVRQPMSKRARPGSAIVISKYRVEKALPKAYHAAATAPQAIRRRLDLLLPFPPVRGGGRFPDQVRDDGDGVCGLKLLRRLAFG